ncbi:hypothetical protein [Rhizobium sp. MHM7A]|uniref:hypothetical protein n=1 Tax=Rhizobium sp. MHM7A TaxID=2583233 RepID=UPI001105F4CD|nr:hypothetical protein [Rhizobium sp. MHM7A]TLX16431.1 hypothetical protein FFR93_03600 [Rhizobium sp. MHM7A]
MTYSIRDACFESNSSSSHSLVIANGDIFELSFSLNETRQGKVILSGQEQGYTRWFRFYRPENILAYLIIAEVENQATARLEAFRKDIADMVSDIRPADILPVMRWNFPVIDSAISYLEGEYGVEFEFLLGRDDTVSMLGTGNLQPLTGYLNKKDRLKALLFHRGSYLETNPQNGYGVQPKFIPTDLGEDDFVADHDEQVVRELQALEDTNRMLEAMIEGPENNDN